MFKVGDRVNCLYNVSLRRDGIVGTLVESGVSGVLIAVFVDECGDIISVPVMARDGRHANCPGDPYIALVDDLKERWDKVDPAVKDLISKLRAHHDYVSVYDCLRVLGFNLAARDRIKSEFMEPLKT